VDESLELDLVVDRGIELRADGAHFHAAASLETGNEVAIDAAADRDANVAVGDRIGIRVVRLADADLLEEPCRRLQRPSWTAAALKFTPRRDSAES
jgi:hypothetical protein